MNVVPRSKQFASVSVSAALVAFGLAASAPAGAAVSGCDGLAWTGRDGSAVEQIWTANADGTGRSEISSIGTGTDPTANQRAQWSPDGTRVAWSGNASGARIFVADVDGSDRVEYSSVDDSSADPTNNFLPQWSPDGSAIAWAGWVSGVDQILVADEEGAGRTVISTVGVGSDPSNNTDPQWSPDGSRIAWSGVLTGVRQIFVADADGANRKLISTVSSGTDPTGNAAPQWSPDGSQLTWTGSDGVTNQIWVADADGENRFPLSTVGSGTDPSANVDPQWSPDGSSIAWEGSTDQNHIFVADADGTDRRVISGPATGDPGEPSGNRQPEWSPDGTLVAWSGYDGGVDDEIWVADAVAGAGRTKISPVSADPDPTVNAEPVWRPRVGEITLAHSTSPLVTGETGTVTVTATTSCPHGHIVISGLDLPCIDAPTRTATVGSFAGSTWTIDALDGSATATITGTVNEAGACAATASVAGAAPALATPVSRSIGGTSTDPTCPSDGAPFTDVASGSFARNDIDCIFALGITTGTTPTTYSPAADVTREQMAAFLARLWRAAVASGLHV